MLRFAWMDASTYNAHTKTGGAHASFMNLINLMDQLIYLAYENGVMSRDRMRQLMNDSPFHAMETASLKCEEVKLKCPALTFADIIQLAGVVALQVAGCPVPIEFKPGRRDSFAIPGVEVFTEQDVLHRLKTFHRMGLSGKDIVALSGGLTLGRREQQYWRCTDISNIRDNLTFDNSYFKDLRTALSEPHPNIHPAEWALLRSPNLRPYLKLYEENADAFFKDYAEAHKKFSELGFTPKNRIFELAQRLLPAAATTAVLVLCYLFESRKRVE